MTSHFVKKLSKLALHLPLGIGASVTLIIGTSVTFSLSPCAWSQTPPAQPKQPAPAKVAPGAANPGMVTQKAPATPAPQKSGLDLTPQPVPIPKPVVVKKPDVKHIIPGAVRLQITPRGMNYFKNNLADLLGNLGVGIDEYYTPSIDWAAETSTDIDKLDIDPEARQILVTIKSMLTEWFVGFSLNGIKPSVAIADSGFIAQFTKLSLTSEPELMAQLGYKTGAVLALEMEIHELNLATSKVRITNQMNPDYGEIGLDNAKLKVGGAIPLKVRMPFYVRIADNGELIFQALSFKQNFNDVNMEFKYKKLIAPSVKIIINNKVMELNQARLIKEFNDNIPKLLTVARSQLSDFASKQLPALLNEKVKEFLHGELEEAKEMPAAGIPDGSKDANYVWGLVLPNNSINLSRDGMISATLNAYIEDPMKPMSNLVANQQSSGPPMMNQMRPEDYDVAVSIDRGFINRIVQLSYERKYFDKFEPNPGQFIYIKKQPVIVGAATPAEIGNYTPDGSAFVKAHLRLRITGATSSDFSFRSIKENAFVNDEIETEFDAILKIEKSGKTAVKIYIWRVLKDSIQITEDSLSWLARKTFTERVMDGIRGALVEQVDKLRTDRTALPSEIPLPGELAGIRLELVKLSAESSGNIITYMKYIDLTRGTK